MKRTYFIAAIGLILASCHNNENDYDAAGAFESVETIVSSEQAGTIMQFNVEEGQTLKVGQFIGYIDTAQLFFRKEQLEDQIGATVSQMPEVRVQIASLESQLQEAQIDQKRFTNLYKDNAATRQQLDDANTKVDVLKKQIAALKSTLHITSKTLLKDVGPLEHQIEQVKNQLQKCYIINPVHGTVLTKYSEDHEVVVPGKALYKIAETDTLILRAYITGTQLNQVKLGQTVKVRTDYGNQQYKQYKGIVYWVSDKSEFTPKTIPTKDERADLVYAIKVKVVNDGFIKIGMYGEVKFN